MRGERLLAFAHGLEQIVVVEEKRARGQGRLGFVGGDFLGLGGGTGATARARIGRVLPAGWLDTYGRSFPSIFDFDRVEVLRGANSVLHGTDSLAGVVSILTRRGRSQQPELAYSIDGGNLSTVRNSIAVGGAVRRFDYFSEYAHFRTDNDLPNNRYTNGTYAGRLGVALGANTDLSATIRRADRVILLARGRIVAEGSPALLEQSSEEYRQIVKASGGSTLPASTT